MKIMNKKYGHTNTLTLITILIAFLGIMLIVFNIKLKNSHKTKWHLLQAQQASMHSLLIAKEMLNNHSLPNNCINISGCPFWSSNHNIRLINKNGTPNKAWWYENAYSISGAKSNSKFIVIRKQNDLYKIIAFAEDLAGSLSAISSGYVLIEN